MKTLSLLILFLFLCSFASGQNGYLRDSFAVFVNGVPDPTTFYSYDDDENLVRIVRGTSETVIAYPNDSTVITERYSDGVLTETELSKNRPDGSVASIEFFDGSNIVIGRDTFFYNIEGREILFVRWELENGIWAKNRIRKQTWNGNNQLSLELLVNSNMDTVFYRNDVFTYDSYDNEITSSLFYVDQFASELSTSQSFYINNELDSSQVVTQYNDEFSRAVYRLYSYDQDFSSVATYQKIDEFGEFFPTILRDNWYNTTSLFLFRDSSHTYVFDGSEYFLSSRGTEDAWQPTSETLNVRRKTMVFGVNGYELEFISFYHKSSSWVSSKETDILENLLVYPNPVIKNSSLVIDNANSDTRTMKIFDLNGILVNTVLIRSGTNKIIAPHLSGIYFIQLFDKAKPVSNMKAIVVE